MRSVLVHADLWDIVDGKSIKRSSWSEEQNKEWEVRDQKALASLMLCINASQIHHIKNCMFSASAWNKLKEIYVPRGPATKVVLYKKLLNTRLFEGQSMTQHIFAFDEILDKIATCGIVISDELVSLILLNSLSNSYESFIIAMEARDSLPGLSSLKIKLLEEAERREQKSNRGDLADNNNNEQQAYMAQSNIKIKRYNNNKTNGKCFNCGQSGHYAKRCNIPKQFENNGHRNKKNNYSYSMFSQFTAEVSDNWCTSHICGNRNMFKVLEEHKENIKLAGNNYITTEGCGEVVLQTENNNIILKNVLYVPNLHLNFMSVSRAVEEGLSVMFKNDFAEFKDDKGNVVLRAEKIEHLFLYKSSRSKCFSMISNAHLWHERFGHLNFAHLQELISKKMVYGMEKVNFIDNNNSIKCKTCMVSKIHVQPFPKASETRSSGLLELIYTDLCGPFPQTINNSCYFMTMIDDYSRMIFIYFLKTKAEAFEKFKTFKNMVECQTGRKIKAV